MTLCGAGMGGETGALESWLAGFLPGYCDSLSWLLYIYTHIYVFTLYMYHASIKS